MSNEIINDLDFEKRIDGMQDRQLLEFVARQTLETHRRCRDHLGRIVSLEAISKKQAGIIGGISGTIAGAIIGIINYFVNRG